MHAVCIDERISIRSTEPGHHGTQADKTFGFFRSRGSSAFAPNTIFSQPGHVFPDLGPDVSLSHERYPSCRKSFSSQRWCCSQLVCTWALLRWLSRFAELVLLLASSAAKSKKQSKATNSSVLVTAFAETLNPPLLLGILQSGPQGCCEESLAPSSSHPPSISDTLLVFGSRPI